MKKLISAAIFILFAYSCRKDAVIQADSGVYLHSVLTHLRDSLSVEDFNRLDTGKAILTNPGTGTLYTLRFPFTGKSLAGDFVLLRTDPAGNILKGQVVHLENTGHDLQFSGNIQLTSLSGRLILNSGIDNGFINAFHGAGRRPIQVGGANPKTVTLLPAPNADWLPEVVVVGYPDDSSPTFYITLDGLLGASSGGILGSSGGSQGDAGSGGGGSGIAGGGSGSGASPGSSPGSSPAPYSPLDPAATPMRSSLGVGVSDPIDVEKEYVYGKPIVDVQKYFNCFDQVPSDGASYTIQLCADVPVNSNPDMSMNFSGGLFAGHTFLVITKSGSSMSISQAFGFYPSGTLSAWNPFSAITSVIRDNGNSEINASIIMTINSDQFNVIRSAAINLSTKPYQLDKSNCSDYAIGVFNSIRTNPLTVEAYLFRQAGIVMGNGMSSDPITVPISNSPQMIYEKLSAMKANGDPEASNIQLNLTHDFRSPNSHGECN